MAKTWHRPFKGLQQLIIRGLTDRATEDLALSCLRESVSAQMQLPAGADPLIDDARSRPVVLVGCLLPWLCQQIESASSHGLDRHVVETVQGLALMCSNCRLSKLSKFLTVVAESRFSSVEVFLARLTPGLHDALIGQNMYAQLVGPLLAMLGCAHDVPHRTYAPHVLMVLHALLSHARLGPSGFGKHVRFESPTRLLVFSLQAKATLLLCFSPRSHSFCTAVSNKVISQLARQGIELVGSNCRGCSCICVIRREFGC